MPSVKNDIKKFKKMTKIELTLKPLVWTPTYNNYYISLSSKYQNKAKLILIHGFWDFPLIIGGMALLHNAESSKFMKSGVFSRGLLHHVWSGKRKHRSKPDNLVWPKFHPIQTLPNIDKDVKLWFHGRHFKFKTKPKQNNRKQTKSNGSSLIF